MKNSKSSLLFAILTIAAFTICLGLSASAATPTTFNPAPSHASSAFEYPPGTGLGIYPTFERKLKPSEEVTLGLHKAFLDYDGWFDVYMHHGKWAKKFIHAVNEDGSKRVVFVNEGGEVLYDPACGNRWIAIDDGFGQSGTQDLKSVPSVPLSSEPDCPPKKSFFDYFPGNFLAFAAALLLLVIAGLILYGIAMHFRGRNDGTYENEVPPPPGPESAPANPAYPQPVTVHVPHGTSHVNVAHTDEGTVVRVVPHPPAPSEAPSTDKK